MLGEINQATLELQKRNISLSECRLILDELLVVVSAGCSDSNSSLHQYKLGSSYLIPNASIVLNPHFEAGVVLIQRNQPYLMTEPMKNACKMLGANTVSDEFLGNIGSIVLTNGFSERLENIRRLLCTNGQD